MCILATCVAKIGVSFKQCHFYKFRKSWHFSKNDTFLQKHEGFRLKFWIFLRSEKMQFMKLGFKKAPKGGKSQLADTFRRYVHIYVVEKLKEVEIFNFQPVLNSRWLKKIGPCKIASPKFSHFNSTEKKRVRTRFFNTFFFETRFFRKKNFLVPQ